MRAVAGSDVISCSLRDHAVRSDVRNVWCVVVAVLMYYFGVAGAIWWAVLTVSWYLAAARKVKHRHVGVISCSWTLGFRYIPKTRVCVSFTWLEFECRVMIRFSKVTAR